MFFVGSIAVTLALINGIVYIIKQKSNEVSVADDSMVICIIGCLYGFCHRFCFHYEKSTFLF